MKWNQLAALNGVMALALWVSPAKAEVRYVFEPLHFKLTVLQQRPIVIEAERTANHLSNLSKGPTSLAINASKLTNKNLLSVLASAFDTNWPAGANLALDRYSSSLYVVDATGTNPVFNVSQGVSLDETNVAFFRCELDWPVEKDQTLIRARPGGASEYSAEGTHYGMAFFQLFIEQDGVTNTDLSFAGLNTTDYRSYFIQSSNSVPVFSHSFYQMKQTIPVMGDGVLDETWSVVRGTVTSRLVTKGGPAVGVPISPPPPAPLPPPTILPPPPNWFTNTFTNIVVLPPILLTNAP